MFTKGGKRFAFWVFLCLLIVLIPETTAKAGNGSKINLDSFNVGVSAIIDPSVIYANEDAKSALANGVVITPEEEQKEQLVMANVQSVLNVREEPNVESNKLGLLYKDCGGYIMDTVDGWTKIKTGNLIGWCSNDYLFFGEEAEKVANDVGTILASCERGAYRVRTEASDDSETLGLVAKGEEIEVLGISEDGWVCVDYDDKDGYVRKENVSIRLLIDHGETMEEIHAREKAEKEAKKALITNYGAATVGADDTMLLAALIQCEAGGESYEGQLAVGAVVMNRVRSKAYPDNVYGVIYASGQFTPALNGKVDQVYLSGRVRESCIRAAEEAIAGNTNVGAACHFRRDNGTRDGVVIGHQVFF